jgi:hypothetical protein
MISSNKIPSTGRGSESGGNGDLQLPQRPVLAKYFAGIRLFWPQWLQARIMGMKRLPSHESTPFIRCLGGFRSLQEQFTAANQRCERRAPIPSLRDAGLRINDGKSARKRET